MKYEGPAEMPGLLFVQAATAMTFWRGGERKLRTPTPLHRLLMRPSAVGFLCYTANPEQTKGDRCNSPQ
jgi:hypothetical protein